MSADQGALFCAREQDAVPVSNSAARQRSKILYRVPGRESS